MNVKRLMKKLLLLVGLCIFVSGWTSSYAIDFVWKDKHGNRYYQCAGNVVGGQAKVKAIDLDQFRVRSALINRIIQARSLYHAAQIACGEAEEIEKYTGEAAAEQPSN